MQGAGTLHRAAMDELSRLDIDLAAISRNLGEIRRVVGEDCRICPVVKSDAYGLGLQRVVPTLEEAGADMFAVFAPREAVEFLSTGSRVPVLVLMPVRDLSMVDPMYPGLRTGQVHLVVHDTAHLDLLEAYAEELDVLLRLHLKLNTGMHRGGCDPGEGSALLERIMDSPRLHLAGICTHFSSSSTCRETTDRQVDRFESFLATNAELIDSDCLLHCASTASVMFGPRFTRNMVRVGLGWVGTCPSASGDASIPGLSPSLRWTSAIVQVRAVPAGEPVGYDGTWRPARDSIIGIVPVGYADGYPVRPSSIEPPVLPQVVGLLRNDRVIGYAPVVGVVSMDQMTIDLTGVVAEDSIGSVGRVELLSNVPGAPNGLRELATASGMKPHAVIARLHPRIRRAVLAEQPRIDVRAGLDRLQSGANVV
ncbi:MAG: alanine racemase [Planctomycetota bacterium]|nr:alanine racemase [Planctomycetota bacterium]